MPGVTFFCIFVRQETNRQGGGNHPLPLVGRGLNPMLYVMISWRHSHNMLLIYKKYFKNRYTLISNSHVVM